MDLDAIVSQIYEPGMKFAEIRMFKRDGEGRFIQTTYNIDFYPDSYEKPYRYNISTRVLDVNDASVV